jgi:coenzyme F420-reducing hydrogenase alpha subunit
LARGPLGLLAWRKPTPTLRNGILLRKFGQEAIRVTAGKRVHGTGSVPGGMNKQVSGEDRVLLQQEVTQRHSMQPRRGLLV